ncbi:hypothetical protein LNQ03_30300 [Klebsiella pneumoniae subsp. pneumoniae]|nr:hypothetical protein [Klebsiella pneumoniae subsp. pneumoniae]
MAAGGSKRFHHQRPPLNAGNIVDELRATPKRHPASHHPLFDFAPASEASAAQIDYFFKSEQRPQSAFLRSGWRWGWWARCRKPALRLRKICGMR